MNHLSGVWSRRIWTAGRSPVRALAMDPFHFFPHVVWSSEHLISYCLHQIVLLVWEGHSYHFVAGPSSVTDSEKARVSL